MARLYAAAVRKVRPCCGIGSMALAAREAGTRVDSLMIVGVLA